MGLGQNPPVEEIEPQVGRPFEVFPDRFVKVRAYLIAPLVLIRHNDRSTITDLYRVRLQAPIRQENWKQNRQGSSLWTLLEKKTFGLLADQIHWIGPTRQPCDVLSLSASSQSSI